MDKPENSKYTCCICDEKCVGWGHNPYPVRKQGGYPSKNRCCETCNITVVIPTRLGNL
jgi:hypothetical protein